MAFKHPAEIDAVIGRVDERIAHRIGGDLESRSLRGIGFQFKIALDPQFVSRLGERCDGN